MGENERVEFWPEIVRLTELPDREFYQPLRVSLLIWLQAASSSPLRRRAREVLWGLKCSLPMPKAVLPPAQKGQIVLCFAHCTPANMQNLLPVAKEALRRGMLGGIVALTDSMPELKEFAGQVPIVSVAALISQLGTRERQKTISGCIGRFYELGRILSAEAPALRAGYRQNSIPILADMIRSAQMAKAMKLLLTAWEPSVVASTSDLWPVEHQFALQASSLQIPSFLIQHGTADECWWPFRADVLVTWGEVFRRKMEELGSPSSRLAIGGMPASDKVFQAQRARAGSSARAAVQDPPVCLILSHAQGRVVEPEIFDRYRGELTAMVQSMPNIRWKVKLHPSEDDSYYRGLGDEVFRRLEIHPRSTSLIDAVEDADVVTTLFSTSGLEAMMMGCPVVVPAVTSRVKELAWWPALGGGIYAADATEFRRCVEELCSNPAARRLQLESQESFIRGSYANPGQAAEAIVDLLSNRSALEGARAVSAGERTY